MILRCPVCSTEKLSPFGDETWILDEVNYTLTQCNSCKSVFTDPLPNSATLDKLYKNQFDYRWYKDHVPAKLRDAKIRYDEYKELLGNSVLDYGGGLGYFSKICRDRGHQSLTYDPHSSDEVQQHKWDTIVALHVLEHINDLDSIISEFRQLINSGGKLIIAVPNFDGLGYQEQGMRWVWAQPPLVHIFHFTASGLMSLLQNHGFTNISISYHERWDANTFCDINNSNRFRHYDGLWGKKPYNSIGVYRKIIAIINSYRRFSGLRKALKDKDNIGIKLAELQIIATAP